ncbi:17484_t:CDS:2, partial [Gigaspora margarita]
HTIEIQNVPSTDAINIQNVTSTDSATSSLISVSPVANNTTNTMDLYLVYYFPLDYFPSDISEIE